MFRPLSPEHPDDETWPGLLILRTEGRLFFANAERVADRSRVFIDALRPRVLVFDFRAIFDIEYTALQMLTRSTSNSPPRGSASGWPVSIPSRSRSCAVRHWASASASSACSPMSKPPLASTNGSTPSPLFRQHALRVRGPIIMKKDKAGRNDKNDNQHKNDRAGAVNGGQAAAAPDLAQRDALKPEADDRKKGKKHKKKGKHRKHGKHGDAALTAVAPAAAAGGTDENGAPTHEKLTGKAYAKQLAKLHVELVKLQEWVKHKGLKVCILFEGRDGAGKGGTIKAITERVSPRVFRVVALPAPTDREKTQMYVQRYLPHLPAAGEIVIFDRSWYNRAGVERVMGFCTEDVVKKFLNMVPLWEKVMVESGIILLKYWLEVSDEGTDAPSRGPHRRRAEDLEAVADGSRSPTAAGTTTRGPATRCSRPPTPASRRGTSSTPNDKKRARLNIISHLLGQIPYKKAPREKVKLPEAPEAWRLQGSELRLQAGAGEVLGEEGQASSRCELVHRVLRVGDGRRVWHLAEHLGAQRQDEREAVVALHPADRNADQIAVLVEHAAAGHARMAVGQARHQAVGRPLPDVAGAEDDALRVVVAEAEDRLGEVVGVGGVDPQRRQVDRLLDLDDRPVARIDFDVGVAGVDDARRDVLAVVAHLDRRDARASRPSASSSATTPCFTVTK